MLEVEDTERAKAQAKAQLESIIEMVKALDTESEDAREEALQAIQEDALSVQVRSGWYQPGETPEAEEYEILLCTGGPAARIIGELGLHDEPETAHLQYQDWFTPWIDYPTRDDDHQALLTYARCFYFGG